MGTRKVDAVEHRCDGGCGKTEFEVDGEPPLGLTIQWIQIDGSGGYSGKLWTCGATMCVRKAMHRRLEIMHEQDEEARR